MNAEQLAASLGRYTRKPGGGFMAQCPAHDDQDPSLSIDDGDDGRVLFKCMAGCEQADVLEALKARGLWPTKNEVPQGPPRVVATFEYRDAAMQVLYSKERIEPGRNGRRKEFRFKQPNGSFGRGDSGPILYNLPAVIKARSVLITEGEQHSDLLASWGLPATTLDSGAQSKLTQKMIEQLTGKRIVILPDNDRPGREYASRLATALHGKAESLKVVDLPGLPEKGDVVDWAKTAGNDKARLLELVKAASEWKPAPEADQAEEGATGSGLEVLRACDVHVEPIAWLWHGWLAGGKLHILAGAPGTGKTTLALHLAAILTKARQWPDGTLAPKAEVAIWSGEDDPCDTLVPRLMAAGADLERVHIIRSVRVGDDKRPFDPAVDMPHLTAYLRQHPAIKLLIVDPVVSAVAGDSHKNAEVRKNLQPLVDLGAACGCAILGISHFSKGTSGRDPLERVTGSIAFGALARVVLAAAKLADDEEGKRLFARAKSNIGADAGGWHYRLDTCELDDHPGVITSKVTWCGEVEGSARELLDTAETTEDREEKGAKAEAKEFLLASLENGPVAAKKIIADAKTNGISEKTLRRAKTTLGIEVRKTGMAGGWQWSLPSKVAKKTEGALQNLRGTFEESGHLLENSDPAQEVLALAADDFEEVL